MVTARPPQENSKAGRYTAALPPSLRSCAPGQTSRIFSNSSAGISATTIPQGPREETHAILNADALLRLQGHQAIVRRQVQQVPGLYLEQDEQFLRRVNPAGNMFFDVVDKHRRQPLLGPQMFRSGGAEFDTIGGVEDS